MDRGIRFIAQCYEIETGRVLEESLLRDDQISKACRLKELGYLHAEQIDFLKRIQVSFPYRRVNTKQHSAVDPNSAHQQTV